MSLRPHSMLPRGHRGIDGSLDLDSADDGNGTGCCRNHVGAGATGAAWKQGGVMHREDRSSETAIIRHQESIKRCARPSLRSDGADHPANTAAKSGLFGSVSFRD